MIEALLKAALLVEANQSGRVAIIAGEGGKSFCAGGDIAAWSGLDAHAFGLHWVRIGRRSFDALARLRVPLIAALNGHVLGGGMELAATADFRIAEEHVKFGLPETGLGIIPGWSGTQRIVRRFGPQVAKRMAIFGEMLTAEQAVAAGLAERCVPRGQSRQAATELAQTLLTRGHLATQATKLLINAAEGEEPEAASRRLPELR